MGEKTNSASDMITIQLEETITDFHCLNCLGSLQDTAPTNCGHRYCLSCIKQWLGHITCPCCSEQLFQSSLIQGQLFYSFIDYLPRHAQTVKKHLEMTIDTCHKEIKLLKDEINFKEEYFRKETDSLLYRLSIAQADIKEKEEKWRETENKFQNEENQIRQLTEELEKSQHSNKMLEIHVQYLIRETDMLKDQIESLQHIDETCQLLEEKYTDIEQDRRSLIGEIGRTSSENQELIKEIAEYKWWSLMRSKPDKQELARAIESKKRKHVKLRLLQSQIDRLTEDLLEKEQELIYLRHFRLF